MADRQTGAPVTIRELLASTLANGDALAKFSIEKGIITQQQFLRKISEERATYQKLFNPRATLKRHALLTSIRNFSVSG